MHDYETCSEIVLIKHACKKDTKAFAKLYENVYKDLYRFALHIMKNRQDAEDAVSEAVMAAYENIHKLKKAEAFRSWIFKILSNICKRKLLALSSRQKREMYDEAKEHDMAVENNYEEVCDVKEAWKLLSDEERLVVGLSVFAGYSSKEIGEILGDDIQPMSDSTVRSKRKRALEKMGTFLK